MRINKVRIIQLKNEYLETLEGQDRLIDIVNEDFDCGEEVEYSEGEYSISDIAVEASYSDLYSEDESKIISDMFLGSTDFNYPYTRWEIEMKTKNPTKEQIAKHIVDTWFYPIDPDNVEEIEAIAQGQEYSFHDCNYLRDVQQDRVKEIVSNFYKESIMKTAEKLEKELNKIGVYTDGLGDNDLKLLEMIINIFKKSAKENTGVLYILSE